MMDRTDIPAATRLIGLALLFALTAPTLSGCDRLDGAEGSRDQVRVVGSSTVYPFTIAVAEQLARKDPDVRAPIVESTGTGAGMKLFCEGVGARYPDVEDASRRIKASEAADCRANGVTRIVEIQIGIDGLALAQSRAARPLALSEADIYRALAATPNGAGANRARSWADVNPALPAIPILVYGPPPTSGTRDAFAELVLQKGCEADPRMKALKATDPDRQKALCTRLREDGPFVEAGENENLIVQKLAADPTAVGIFGYGSIAENADRLRGIPLQGITPTYATIADYSYPGARPLFIYVKAAHLDAVPGLRGFVAEYARAWNPGGYLVRRGLIAAPDGVRAAALAKATALMPMDLDAVK